MKKYSVESIEVPENFTDLKNILLNQIGLIKRESEQHPEKLPELSAAMCEVFDRLTKYTHYV